MCIRDSPGLERKLHGLHDFLGVHLAQGAAHHREILAERRHRAAVHEAGADDHAVRGQLFVGQAEMLAGVLGVSGYFLKGVFLDCLLYTSRCV